MEAVEIPPWRESPFVVGRHYRVIRDFQALRDTFTAGEILVYERDAWSRYDGITGYFFSEAGSGELRSWDIDDGEDLGVWRDLFEELPND